MSPALGDDLGQEQASSSETSSRPKRELRWSSPAGGRRTLSVTSRPSPCTHFSSSGSRPSAFADRLDSERKARVDIAKACADVNTAGASNLPAICGTFKAKPPDTPAAARAQALKDLQPPSDAVASGPIVPYRDRPVLSSRGRVPGSEATVTCPRAGQVHSTMQLQDQRAVSRNDLSMAASFVSPRARLAPVSPWLDSVWLPLFADALTCFEGNPRRRCGRGYRCSPVAAASTCRMTSLPLCSRPSVLGAGP